MKLKQLLKNLLVAAAMLSAVDAAVASVTSTIDAGIRGTQQGRLSRNGLPQDYSGSEPFPGVINTSVTYFYSTFQVNVGSLNYLEIDFDSVSPNTFVSAYQGNYFPTSLSTNWLGDAGTSGNSFGTDILTFNVIALANSVVTIVVSNTAAGGVGINAPFTLFVLASPDSQGTVEGVELAVTRVPEPSTLLLLLAPLGLVAGRKLRARRNTTGAVAAA